MNIGVDATCWQNNRGYGRHARALLSTLIRLDSDNRYTFFMDSSENAETVPSQAKVRLVQTSAPTVLAASANSHRSARDVWRMSRAMSDGSFDLLLFPTLYSYIPVYSRAKKIVMIHDIIPDQFPDLTLPTFASRLFWKTKSALARWQADAIVAVSDYSRRAIIQHFNVDPSRVFVVGEASDPMFRVIEKPLPTSHLASLGISTGKRYIVYVGGFGPHKNLVGLVDAFGRLVARQEFSDVHLIMVGEYRKEVFHSYFTTIESKVNALGIGDRVCFTGYLPDEDLVVLLNISTVLGLPSLMEGFGLPAIEAAACGCPVIATNASPLPTLLGEAAIYIDPNKPQELEQALVRVLESPELRRQMREEGLVAARRLTWDAAARQMLSLLQSVGAH